MQALFHSSLLIATSTHVRQLWKQQHVTYSTAESIYAYASQNEKETKPSLWTKEV